MSELIPAPPALLPPADLDAQVRTALHEDVGRGDVTAALVPSEQRVRGRIVSREAAILCGQPWVEACFGQLDPQIRLTWHVAEGAPLAPGALVCTVEGAARGVLTGERTALNFLQLLSGTATAAHRFAQAVAGTGCTVLDTRKTLPGLRTAQKYAVRCGGSANHRMGLYDMVLIKENHILAAGSIGAAVDAARRLAAGVRIEVEVESLDELEQAFAAAPDIVMLDEFSLQDMREAVRRNRARGRAVQLEASGSVSLENIGQIAATGVDFISVGALTKHVRAVDLSMRLEFQGR